MKKCYDQLFENATKKCVKVSYNNQRVSVLYSYFYICAYRSIAPNFRPFYEWTNFKHLSLHIQQPVALKHANFALVCKCYQLVYKKSDFVIWLELIFSFLDSWIWYTQVVFKVTKAVSWYIKKKHHIQNDATTIDPMCNMNIGYVAIWYIIRTNIKRQIFNRMSTRI